LYLSILMKQTLLSALNRSYSDLGMDKKGDIQEVR
jgi:hypothetical protein